ncbi:MAG: twin-arginine translocase TatA/TatE family subunit [Phocaeicola sp.]|nr:twin-arginine translocase TatA/TatE family subunit [Phocaeicola sp.]
MYTLLLLGVGMQELLFIALIILLFFGGKKIPELMKGLGKGVKSFKDGINGIEDADTATSRSDKSESSVNQENKSCGSAENKNNAQINN